MKNSTKAMLLVLMALVGCAGVPSKVQEVWSPVSTLKIREEPSWHEFSAALSAHIQILESQNTELRFGSHTIASEDLAGSLRWCLAEAKKSKTPHQRFLEIVREYFIGLRAFQQESLITGYYQPVYNARLQAEPPYTQPLYRKPSDLLILDLEAFQKLYSGEHHRAFPTGMRLRGRVAEGKVVPYWSRDEIDRIGVLQGQDLEIAYVDPVDAFFLQIQGSGKLLLKDGRSFWVGFAEQNGQPYLAVGRRLRDHLSSEQMGMEALRAHMHSLGPEELEQFLSENPSYVFFERRQHRATGALGLQPYAGRTVAVDPSVYGLGGLGFLEFSGTSKVSSRMVFFQDKGGAIKGSRVDLFTGEGEQAGVLAGELKEKAQLTVLLPSPKLLSLSSRSRP